MKNNKSEKPKEQIVLEYYEEDLCKFWGYEKFIKRHVQLGHKIPARVLKTYFGLFDKPVFDNKEMKKRLINNARELTLKNIEKYKQSFSFDAGVVKKGRKRNIKIDTSKINGLVIPEPLFVKPVITHFSSTIFVNEYCNKLLNLKDIETIVSSQNKLVADVTKQLYYYVNTHSEPPQNGFPSDYKLTIIIGLILVSFGYLHDKETWEDSGSKYKLYHAYLNKAVQYHFDRFIASLAKKNR